MIKLDSLSQHSGKGACFINWLDKLYTGALRWANKTDSHLLALNFVNRGLRAISIYTEILLAGTFEAVR